MATSAKFQICSRGPFKSGDFDKNGENGDLAKFRQRLNENSYYMTKGTPWKVAVSTMLRKIVLRD